MKLIDIVVGFVSNLDLVNICRRHHLYHLNTTFWWSLIDWSPPVSCLTLAGAATWWLVTALLVLESVSMECWGATECWSVSVVTSLSHPAPASTSPPAPHPQSAAWTTDTTTSTTQQHQTRVDCCCCLVWCWEYELHNCRPRSEHNAQNKKIRTQLTLSEQRGPSIMYLFMRQQGNTML